MRRLFSSLLFLLLSVSLARADITSNLVAQYKMDENTGLTVGDSVGTCTGTIYSGDWTTWTTPLVGVSALAFADTTGSRVSIGNCTAIGNLTASFTVVARIKPASVTGVHRILAPSRTTTANGWAFATNGAGFRFTSFGVVDYDSTTVTMSTGTTYCVGATMNSGGNVTFYLDGTNKETVTHSGGANANTDDTSYIGITETGGGFAEPFDGVIDELRVYSRALSDGDHAEYCAYTGEGSAARRPFSPTVLP